MLYARCMPARRVLLVLTLAACGDPGASIDDSSGTPPPTTIDGASAPEPTVTTGAAGSSEASGAISEPWMGSGVDATTTGLSGTTTSDGDSSTGDPLAECPRLRVMVPDGEVLNVRPDPSTAGEPVGVLADGALVDAVAAVQGQAIDGVSLWYEVAAPSVAGFVFSGFVACTLDEHPPKPAGYFLPLVCGMGAKVTQGNDGDVSHQGKDFYAFDFGLGTGTPLVAMADGTVHHIYAETGPGDPCYNGGGPECSAYGNLVVILHGDNTSTYYKHLSEVHVTLGQQVARAQTIGLSGSTGYSTGRHAHIMRQENCGASKCQSIPLEFVEVGVPVKGQQVVSMNCP